MTLGFDLKKLPEDERIQVLGKSAMSSPGLKVGFVVENDEKADRYIRKLKAAFPQIVLVEREHANGLVYVRITGRAPVKET